MSHRPLQSTTSARPNRGEADVCAHRHNPNRPSDNSIRNQDAHFAIYSGTVSHARFTPKKHQFQYPLFLFWLDLTALEQQDKQPNTLLTQQDETAIKNARKNIAGIHLDQKGWVQFRKSDYLTQASHLSQIPNKAANKTTNKTENHTKDNTQPKTGGLGTDVLSLPLHERAKQRMSELAGEQLDGRVFFLGQLRMLGWYFSPVNFYYLQQADGHFSHVLAEVSNTPWNERHHYLVSLPAPNPHSRTANSAPNPTHKAFHVSPFNPMDMQYHWHFNQPNDYLNISITCKACPVNVSKHSKTTPNPNEVEEKPLETHFIAGLTLQREALTPKNLRRHILRIPSLALKTVAGIYWQALILLLKRVPIYTKPAKP